MVFGENSCLFVSIRGYAVFGVFGNDGSDSSILTQGNLSSRKITFLGAKGVGYLTPILSHLWIR
jgi:hypothetical protein